MAVRKKKAPNYELKRAQPRLPSPEDMLAIVFDLERRLMADVARGREELRHLFRNGRIDLVPQQVLHRSERDPPAGPTHTTALRGNPRRAAVYSE
jgi:hypothetical protein